MLTRIIRTLAFCSTLIVLAGALEINSAADVSVRKFDEFKGAHWEDAMARLDNFVLDLRNDPSSVGVIVVYGGQNRPRGEMGAWSDCLRDYLQNRRGLEPVRIVMARGGYKQTLTVELWTTPDRNGVPAPTPEIKSELVRFKGRPIMQWRSICGL
jgi:hypothetical protein